MKQLITTVLFFFLVLPLFSQGASVAPTRLYFNNDLGQVKSKIVTVLNKTDSPQSYQVSFLDFAVDNKKGKPTLMMPEDNPHSISPWISATPSYFTVQAGETMKVKVTLDIPNVPEANAVKWGAMAIKLAKEQMDPLDQQMNDMGMAIVNTFQIVIYAFQTPPSITDKSAEIYDFKYESIDDKKSLQIATENTSESILDCHTYLEYTNLNSGESLKTLAKRFTLLPGGSKETKFNLPPELKSGKYSVMGVVDYGSSSQIQAAELEIVVD